MTPKKHLKAMSARQIVAERVCPNCGGSVGDRPRGPRSFYCSPKCKNDYNNRAKRDGGAIIKFAKAWRETRGAAGIGADSFKAMTAAIDIMLEADRNDGRPSACYGAAVLLSQHNSYMDRRRA